MFEKKNVGVPNPAPGVDNSLKVSHGFKFTQMNIT